MKLLCNETSLFSNANSIIISILIILNHMSHSICEDTSCSEDKLSADDELAGHIFGDTYINYRHFSNFYSRKSSTVLGISFKLNSMCGIVVISNRSAPMHVL